jgi:broad specificity phosphatase PhoE
MNFPEGASTAISPTAAVATGTTTILIVRHTEVHNPRRVLYGRLPEYQLSAYGEQQAERTAAFLANRPIAAIYSSPLLRACQTADRIAARHPVAGRYVTDLLYETGTSWEGTPFAEFTPGFSCYQHRRTPEDETIDDIRARMLAFIEQIRLEHPGETVVGVSHGDPITILRLALRDRPLTPAALRGADYAGLGSVTEIVYTAADDLPQVTVPAIPWTP